MTKIKLSAEDRKIAEIFADERTSNDGENYKRRRGAFKREDIVCGALAELGAFEYLYSQGIEVNYPDFTIHQKKSFGADLITLSGAEVHYAVKGQTLESEAKYGNSYLFQHTDKLVSNPRQYDKIVCCVVDLNENIVYIRSILDAEHVVWGKPRIKWLERTKVALYLEDNYVEGCL